MFTADSQFILLLGIGHLRIADSFPTACDSAGLASVSRSDLLVWLGVFDQHCRTEESN